MIAICIKEGLEQLSKGSSYEVSETPVMYDPNTFEPVVGFMTRYGYVELTNVASSFGNAADYLSEINVSNLSFQ